jgi:nucleoside-diphosphate kinase
MNEWLVFCMERTFIILKPDAMQRGLAGKILSRFERRGLKIVAAKMIHLTKEKCDEHYAHLKGKPFFAGLVTFMTSTPVICAVLEGKDAVELVRKMCGATNARAAEVGTIRGDFGLSTQANLIHASDSKETAEKEIARFFSKNEMHQWERDLEASYTYSADEKG